MVAIVMILLRRSVVDNINRAMMWMVERSKFPVGCWMRNTWKHDLTVQRLNLTVDRSVHQPSKPIVWKPTIFWRAVQFQTTQLVIHMHSSGRSYQSPIPRSTVTQNLLLGPNHPVRSLQCFILLLQLYFRNSNNNMSATTLNGKPLLALDEETLESGACG